MSLSPNDSSFKKFMVEQNLQSWFLDTSLPNPHVIFLHKGKFPGASLVAQMVKYLPAMQETWV